MSATHSLHLTASLHSVTDTLHHNWDCAYTNDFKARLKDFIRAHQTLVIRATLFVWGVVLWLDDCLGFEPRLAQSQAGNMWLLTDALLKPERWGVVGRDPSLHYITWHSPSNWGRKKILKGERERVSPHPRERDEKEHKLITRFAGFALSSFW